MEAIQIPELSPEEAAGLFKGDIDWDLARERGLTDGDALSETYLDAEAAYMASFNELLVREFGFGDYQQMLDEHPWEYPTGGTEEAVIANGAFGRRNIFIRNAAYVERLNADDLMLLSGAMEGDQLRLSDALLEMVAETYADVLEVRAEGFSTPFRVLYQDGVFVSQSAPNDALVFVVSYQAEYDGEGNIANPEIEEAKDGQVDLLKDLMESEMSERTGRSVSVFVDR